MAPLGKDALAGIMFALFGAAAVVLARQYPRGTLARMGPGFFPTVLGAVLVALGLLL
jgi:hypothetical protein